MPQLFLIAAIALGQAGAAEVRAEDVRPGDVRPGDVRAEYEADAKKYVFYQDADHRQEFLRREQPIMRWSSDDGWSGDVFVWTCAGRPGVVGCILSGPIGDDRLCFHEFHLLATQPIAPVDLKTKRRWQPASGVATTLLAGAPPPAETPAGRLVQMRTLSREFSAHMEADGTWELRLLPQPLFRYGNEKSDIVDGALFAYVWTKGTDPELILLLECRREADALAWHFAPVRFSNRPLQLKHEGREVWSVDSHREPAGESTDLVYTTAYARRLETSVPAPEN
jgi:hypothetical protein